jgi:hypothetical protein
VIFFAFPFAVFAALREIRSEFHAKLAKNAKEDAKEEGEAITSV